MMESWEDIFRQSSERDRQFPVSATRWQRLAEEMEQQEAKKRPGAWWLALLIGVGLLLCVMVVIRHEKQIEIEPAAQASVDTRLPDAPAAPDRADHKDRVTPEPDAKHGTVNEIKKQTTPPSPPVLLTNDLPQSNFLPAKDTVASALQRSLVAASPDTVALRSSQLSVSAESANKNELSEETVAVADHTLGTTKQALQRLTRTSPTLLVPARAFSFTIRVPAPQLSRPEQTVDSEWHLSISGSQLLYSPPRLVAYFTPSEAGMPSTSVYTFPNGDTLGLNFAGNFPQTSDDRLRFLRVNVNRIFRSGIGLKAGLIHSFRRDVTTLTAAQIEQVPDVFYYTNDSRLSSWSAQLGIDYTLWRHRRIQPRVGLTTLLTLHSVEKRETFAVFPSQDYRHREFSGRDVVEGVFFGMYLDLGAQWRFHDRWSVGPDFLVAGFPGSGSPVRAAAGVELRYRWY